MEAGWASYRDLADLMDFRVYGADGGAELRAAQSLEISDTGLRIFTDHGEANADYAVQPSDDGNHPAVVEKFVAAICAGQSEVRL